MSRYHFMGIGGVGMSALAKILLERGEEVSGSDQKESAVTQQLEKIGARIFFPQKKENIQGTPTIIYSTAIKEDNPEWQQAKQNGCLFLHRSELLERLLAEKKALVIAGAHGKTTTTALSAHTLVCLGRDPSYVVGGFSPTLEGNGKEGRGEYFVVEGDESDGSFLRTAPYGAIVTSTSEDHIDFWKTQEALERAYHTFIEKIQDRSLLFYHGDDSLLQKVEGTPYGFSSRYPLYATNIESRDCKMFFTIYERGKNRGQCIFPMMGRHNVLNALAVFGLMRALGGEVDAIRNAFLTFQGVGRRMQYRGKKGGALLYDDYAHHPEEVAAAIASFKESFPNRRPVIVFQPHRYSRFERFFKEFGEVLKSENTVIVTDIYGAGEQRSCNVDARFFCKELLPNASYIPRADLASFLEEFLQEKDALLTLGAGDITHVAKELSEG